MFDYKFLNDKFKQLKVKLKSSKRFERRNETAPFSGRLKASQSDYKLPENLIMLLKEIRSLMSDEINEDDNTSQRIIEMSLNLSEKNELINNLKT